jgi:thiamine-monophosphate kinase
LNENQLIAWLSSRRGVSGIGDDCYVMPGSSEDLVFTTDMLVEGVHFRRSLTPSEVGHRALARGLSDIAAMLAEPRFCLLSIAVAPWCSDAWIRRFYDGLLKLAHQSNCPLSGGDLSHASEFVADISVVGAVPRGKAALRSGAKPGDFIYVSSPLGGNAASGYRRKPRPRLDLVKKLRGQVTACMDITDGLSLDLHRLCLASGVGADLDLIPVAPRAELHHALTGGEDYELLFTSWKSLHYHRIGRIVKAEPGTLRYQGRSLQATGYDHFKGRVRPGPSD